MPLSDEHRHALDEIERALKKDDPRFAATVNIDQIQRHRRRWTIIAAALFLLGVVLLITGLVTSDSYLLVGAIIGSIGFLTMPAAIAVFLDHRFNL